MSNEFKTTVLPYEAKHHTVRVIVQLISPIDNSNVSGNAGVIEFTVGQFVYKDNADKLYGDMKDTVRGLVHLANGHSGASAE